MGHLRWTMLREFGSSRVLKTSYFWLLFVPLAARGLANVKENLALTIFGDVINVSFDLPFSWKVFYYAAVCFSIAGIIYSWRCPAIVKRYAAFPAFVDEGRGVPYLRSITSYLRGSDSTRVERLLFQYENGVISDGDGGSTLRNPERRDREKLAEAFWLVHRAANYSDRASLTASFVFYAVGFVLLGIVLFENFVFVVRATF
jgi:hypothetical protein